VYDYVLESIFGVYLSSPSALSTRLLHVKGSVADKVAITPTGLEFSLPSLYDFAVLEMRIAGTSSKDEQSYGSFRRCLYGQQTQLTLRHLGGEVVIAHNQQQVDLSLYRLQALNEKGS